MSTNLGPYYQRPLKPFKPIPPRRPDLLEYVVRFVFGFVIGFLLFFFSSTRSMTYGDYKSVLIQTFLLSSLLGLISAIWGDRFWNFWGDGKYLFGIL